MPIQGYGRFQVRDAGARQRLRGLKDRLVRHYGSATAAGQALGLNRHTLGLVGRRTTIAQRTLRALEQGLRSVDRSGRLSAEIAECVMGRDGRRFYDRAYRSWCEERQMRWVYRRGASWQQVGADIRLLGPARTRRSWRLLLLDRLVAQVRREESELVRCYHRRMDRMGIPTERQKVALVRVVEPLLESAESGFVERGWSELSPKHRRAFLRHGYLRELVLLTGEHPQQRIQRLARGERP